MDKEAESVKPKVLLLPGYACRAQIWGALCERLAEACNLTCIDWPQARTPEWHTVAGFVDWLLPQARRAGYAFIIGHSMGGLAALELAQRIEARPRAVVLVESFLLPPGPFFRNLFLPTTPAAVAQPMLDMLQREREYYSPRLAEALKQVDYTRLAAGLGLPLYTLYGDRGCGDPPQVVEALGWPAELQARVTVSMIQGACHFPMLENPEMTTQVVAEILACDVARG